MKKALLVAKREYLFTVRRKGFIIATIGMPLFFVIIYGIAGGAAFLAMRETKSKTEKVGIVDESGIVQFQLLDLIQNPSDSQAVPEVEMRAALKNRSQTRMSKLAVNLLIQRFPSRDEAKAAFLRKDIRGYYVIAADFIESGAVQLAIKKGGFMSDNEPGWSLIRKLLQASLVEGKLPQQTARRVWNPPILKSQALTDGGQPDKGGEFAEITGFAVPYIFGIFFMISIMSSAGYLLQGVAEEKENRVIEVLLSSVTPDQLLAGKILGLGGAGLTQLSAWILMGVVPALYFLPFLELRWSQLVVALIFFLLGFLLFGALMGGSGSLGNNARESQQSAMVWSFSAVIPMFFLTLIMAQPNGITARVCSYIPLTAPVTMMMRVGAAPVPWWDILLSATILCASLFFFIRLAAKLFRLGTLMYGKRPSVVEIVRWLREA
jgi:ABC-2 type transport system permease protein